MEYPEHSPEMTLDSLRAQLESAGINTSQWGKGKAKTLADLLNEIQSGETELVRGSSGELIRRVTVCKADVFYSSPEEKRYRLVETKQVFRDGRERRRELGQAISEKMKPGEDPGLAIVRGIQEELGIEGSLIPSSLGTDTEANESPSFPGLKSEYVRHLFSVELGEGQYRPEGYIEEQPDKQTFFNWVEVV